jgi:hypothetical protein
VALGRADDRLLDTYHTERHPVGKAVLENAQAQTALMTAFSPEGLALRRTFGALIDRNPTLAHDLALSMSGLDVSYPSSDQHAHPLTGVRVRDSAVYSRLSDGRPLLIRFGDHDDVDARAAGLEVPACDPWPGHEKTAYALIRPDGYVWWATDEPGTPDIAGTLAALGMRLG